MSKKQESDIKEFILEASEIAQQLPENLQVAGFNRALDFLTEHVPVNTTMKRAPKKNNMGRSGVRQDGSSGESIVDDLIGNIDSTQHPEIKSASKTLDRSLMVLQLALTEHDVDGLSPPDISKILTNKFRNSTTADAVNKALGRAIDLVDRVPQGKTYIYRIMASGDEYLKNLGDTNSTSTSSTGNRRKKSNKKKVSRKKGNATSITEGKNKKASPGTGAVTMLHKTIGSGFLKEPRTIGEICAHCEVNYAKRIKPNEISGKLARMVRDGKLGRSKNADGQYQYTAPKENA